MQPGATEVEAASRGLNRGKIERQGEKPAAGGDSIDFRNWRLRLAILRAVYEARGKRHAGFRRAGTAPSVAYYHRDVCDLFAMLLDYVSAAGKSVYREKYSWEQFWPTKLDEPTLMAAAGVDDRLKPRLDSLGLLSDADAGSAG